MNRFAISDIHGCANSFKALLEKINFSKDDILYLLGDYIDRGPDSRGVIDHIWALQIEGYNIHCLLGNHEQMLLDSSYKSTSFYKGELNTLHSFSANTVSDIPKKYIDWMESLESFFELEDYILVHAGLNFNIPNPLDDLGTMIWIRDWYKNINRNWLGEKLIIHGHTPISKFVIEFNIKSLEKTPVINIDSGCIFDRKGLGYLCAFNMNTHELFFQKNLD